MTSVRAISGRVLISLLPNTLTGTFLMPLPCEGFDPHADGRDAASALPGGGEAFPSNKSSNLLLPTLPELLQRSILVLLPLYISVSLVLAAI